MHSAVTCAHVAEQAACTRGGGVRDEVITRLDQCTSGGVSESRTVRRYSLRMADRTGEDDAPRGLFTGFESYRTPDVEDYRNLFSDGMIVVDANVLLDLYLYYTKTRDTFILVLSALQERLWVPHQVVKEFWKNRDNKLRDPRETDSISRDLENRSTTAINTLRAWSNRVHLPREAIDELSRTLSNAFQSVIGEVKKQADNDGREFASDTGRDPLLIAMVPILEGRVGPPFTGKDYVEAEKEARSRIVDRRPPGYMDGGKDGSGPIGDYLVWAQILLEAKSCDKDVLFVTSDNKEDWWRKDEDKRSLGPRPELADEFTATCGRRLFMIAPDGLLNWAREILDIEITDEEVQEVKQISLPPRRSIVHVELSRSALTRYEEMPEDDQLMFDSALDRLRNSVVNRQDFQDLAGTVDSKKNGIFLLRWSDIGRALFRVRYIGDEGALIDLYTIDSKKQR